MYNLSNTYYSSTSSVKGDGNYYINFLDFIIKSEGDGPDPYDEILQVNKVF
jgi:hypothetical protein